MKKSLIALAVLAASGAAMAQSTVTLYGLVDANVGAFKTNAVAGTAVTSLSQTKQDSGGLNGSRWGLKGSEDLGGGLAAIFNVESGFNIDTGASAQGGLLFGRRANVGLAGGFGKLEVGRNSSSYDDISADHAQMAQYLFDPSNTNNGNSAATAKGMTPGPVSATVTAAQAQATALGNQQKFLNRTFSWIGYNTRFDNSFKYTSPNLAGFTTSVMYSLGEDKTTALSASKTVSANVKYANGPLLVSAGYQSETTASSVTATTKPALENAILNVAYNFGVAKVGLGLNRAKYKDVAAPAILGGGEFAAQNEYSLSVAVPIGAATISAGYAQSKGDTLGKSSGFGIQALYALSKRTTLYGGGVSTSAYDKLADAVAASAPGTAIARNTTYAVGIRHTF
ncbi:porin [Rhodoferax sp.]|uniref:porin n=1 Tax=Rhodoferax sp. TaxID=50421 RepID=UPI00374DA891